MKNHIVEAYKKGASIEILMKDFDKSKEDIIQAIIESEDAVKYYLEQLGINKIKKL